MPEHGTPECAAELTACKRRTRLTWVAWARIAGVSPERTRQYMAIRCRPDNPAVRRLLDYCRRTEESTCA